MFRDDSGSDIVPHDSLYFYKVRKIDCKIRGTVFQPDCEGFFTDGLLISRRRKSEEGQRLYLI
jgi:hypothetical protein